MAIVKACFDLTRDFVGQEKKARMMPPTSKYTVPRLSDSGRFLSKRQSHTCTTVISQAPLALPKTHTPLDDFEAVVLDLV